MLSNFDHHLIRVDRREAYVLSPSPSDRLLCTHHRGLASEASRTSERPSRPTPWFWLCSLSSQAVRRSEGARVQRALQRVVVGTPSCVACAWESRLPSVGRALRSFETAYQGDKTTFHDMAISTVQGLLSPCTTGPCSSFEGSRAVTTLGIRNVDATARTRGDRRQRTTVNGVRGSRLGRSPEVEEDGKELGPGTIRRRAQLWAAM